MPTLDVVVRAKAALEGETVADFFTACRSLVPELIVEVEALRLVLNAIREELTNITDDHVYDRLAKVVGLGGPR